MTTKFLFTFAAFAIFTLSSLGEKPNDTIAAPVTETINPRILEKEMRVIQLENESACLDYEIEVTAYRISR